MSRLVKGRLEYPDGTALSNATVRLVSTDLRFTAGDGGVPISLSSDFSVDAIGVMSANVKYGQYRVTWQAGGESTWQVWGDAVVEAGGAIEPGELIEFSDTDLLSTYADVATRAWVISTYSAGAPSSLDITGLDVGTAEANEFIAVHDGGYAIRVHNPRPWQYFLSQGRRFTA